MPYIKRVRVVLCPSGTPLKRIHTVKCRCGHGFKVDLGPIWKKGLVLRCPRCEEVVAKTTEDGNIGVIV